LTALPKNSSVILKVALPTFFLPMLSKIGTRRFQRFVVDHFPWKPLHEIVNIVDVMHETAVEVYETRKAALEEGDEMAEKQPGRGRDIMSTLSACCFLMVWFGDDGYLCSACK
jgi:hypothetical protein